MAFLDTLFGGGLSILGGLLGQKNQQSLAAQNLQNQMMFAQKGLQWRAADATAAQNATGINRLTLLGAPTASFQSLAGSSDLAEGVRGAGNIVGEGDLLGGGESETDKLNKELIRAKIDATKADITHQQLINSKLATDVVAPGPARNMPWDWNRGGPVDPRPMRGAQPLFSRYYDPSDRSTMDLLSPEASQATQSAASLAEAPILALRMYLRNLAGASVNPGAWRESDKMAPWFPWN